MTKTAVAKITVAEIPFKVAVITSYPSAIKAVGYSDHQRRAVRRAVGQSGGQAGGR